MKDRLLGLTIGIGLLFAPWIPTSIQADIFLEIPEIRGESKASDFEGTIEVHSWSWEMNKTVEIGSSSGGGGSTSKATIGALRISKYLDASTAPLLVKAVGAPAIPVVTLRVVSTTGGDVGYINYLNIRLENVYVTSYQVSGDRDGRPAEDLEFKFQRINLDYYQIKNDGTQGTKHTFQYDLSTGV